MYQGLSTAHNVSTRTISYGPWPGGIRTVQSAESASRVECEELLNMVVMSQGQARTRDGLSLVTTGCAGEVVHIKDIEVAGTWETLIGTVDPVGPTYRVYKQVGGGVSLIGTVEGPPRFVGFNKMAMIFDGSYIKYWDGGSAIQMAYDDGIGQGNYHFNNRFGEDDTVPPIDRYQSALGSGPIDRLGYKFTTDVWDAGYYLPASMFYLSLAKKGNGFIGTEVKIVVRIRLVSTDAIVYSRETIYPSKLTASVTGADWDDYYEVEDAFEASDLQGAFQGLSPNTEYYFSVEYDGGDASNFVWLLGCDLTDPSNGYVYNATGPWTQTSVAPFYGLRALAAPKAVDGVVSGSRLFVIEGPEGTSPEKVWYSGVGNHLDWSSPDSGGWLDAGKSVGALASYYDTVWLFGTPRDPGVRRIDGASPAAFKITDTLQRVSGHYKSIITTPGHIVFLHPDGIDDIQTMQAFGDLRARGRTDQVQDIIHDYYSDEAIGGYYPTHGVYLCKFEASDDILAVHLVSGSKQLPVSVWRFALAGETVTAFGGEGSTYVGTSLGNVYKIDHDVLTDGDYQPSYSVKSAFPTTGFGEAQAWELSIDVFSENGGSFDVTFRTNHGRAVHDTRSFIMPTDVTSLDPDTAVVYDRNFERENINFNFRSLQIGFENIVPNGHNPLFFRGVRIITRQIGGM